MRVFALWHGGASYSVSSIHDNDLEQFESIAAAEYAFRDRFDSNGRRTVDFHYVQREPDSTYVPAVDESSTMDIYKYDPRESDGDAYPDFQLSFGPRGGVRRESF